MNEGVEAYLHAETVFDLDFPPTETAVKGQFEARAQGSVDESLRVLPLA